MQQNIIVVFVIRAGRILHETRLPASITLLFSMPNLQINLSFCLSLWYDNGIPKQRMVGLPMTRFMKRILTLWLIICLLPAFSLAEEEAYPPYPTALQINVEYENWTAENGLATEVGLPHTCRRDVDKVLLQAQQELWAAALPLVSETDTLEMIPTYRVSGTSWAGFLLTSRVIREIQVPGGNNYDETIFLAHRVLTYDMNTGTPLTLADVFPESSPAWQMIAQEAEKQLRAYWPDQARDESYIAEEYLPALRRTAAGAGSALACDRRKKSAGSDQSVLSGLPRAHHRSGVRSDG